MSQRFSDVLCAAIHKEQHKDDPSPEAVAMFSVVVSEMGATRKNLNPTCGVWFGAKIETPNLKPIEVSLQLRKEQIVILNECITPRLVEKRIELVGCGDRKSPADVIIEVAEIIAKWMCAA